MNIIISDKKKKDLFISIFHLLKNSSSQINAILDGNNLHIQGMDKSHICLFDLNLKQKWFSTYDVKNSESICFDTTIFHSIISVKSEEQSLVIKKITDDNLSIELISSEKKGDYNKFFTMPLIEYEYEEMNIPKTEYDAELTISSKKMTDMLSQLNNFGDDINIKCSDECVDFKTKGSSGEMRVNIPIDDMTSYSIVEDEEVNLTYSLAYINKMCVTNKLSTEIELCLSNERPMKISYDLGEDSFLVFYIAPKLDSD